MTKKKAVPLQRAEPASPDDARAVRCDAQRNITSLLQAALDVFTASGVDAPVREIAEKAGVGVGTLYRHFPRRSDLVVAVFQNEVDACACAAGALAKRYEPAEALSRWIQRYVDFLVTKRGLAAALHSGDPAFASLPNYFEQRLRPALEGLLKAAHKAGKVRGGIDAMDLLRAVGSLSTPVCGSTSDYPRRMAALLVDGLRFGAKSA